MSVGVSDGTNITDVGGTNVAGSWTIVGNSDGTKMGDEGITEGDCPVDCNVRVGGMVLIVITSEK